MWMNCLLYTSDLISMIFNDKQEFELGDTVFVTLRRKDLLMFEGVLSF